MPTIYDLLGLWRAISCSTLIVFRTIAAANFHTGMVPKPLSKGFCAAVFEQVDRLMRLSISKQGPIASPSSKGEVVNAQHLWSRSGQCGHHPLQDDSSTARVSGGDRKIGEALREGLSGALPLLAAETTDSQDKLDHATADRQVLGGARVITMDTM